MPKFHKESIDRFFDYDIHPESRTIYIGDVMDGEVGPALAERVIKALHLLQVQSKESAIKVILNSKGGDWYDGIAIYDAIKACPCHVTIEVFGAAMSMGSIILQAADERIMHPNATLMIHDGSDYFEGHARNMEAWAKQSALLRKRMYEIYSEVSGKPASFWEKKCLVDYVLTATEAVEQGLADKVAATEEEAAE
jgi:ATP-dependent Clp endopeptidase proteolytic subunit ClpP